MPPAPIAYTAIVLSGLRPPFPAYRLPTHAVKNPTHERIINAARGRRGVFFFGAYSCPDMVWSYLLIIRVDSTSHLAPPPPYLAHGIRCYPAHVTRGSPSNFILLFDTKEDRRRNVSKNEDVMQRKAIVFCCYTVPISNNCFSLNDATWGIGSYLSIATATLLCCAVSSV